MTEQQVDPTGPGYDRPLPLGTGALAMFGPFLMSCIRCGAALLIQGGRPAEEEPTLIKHGEFHGRIGDT